MFVKIDEFGAIILKYQKMVKFWTYANKFGTTLITK